ncbi:MAG: TrkA family potassium uptake protein [Streptosporangiales bacterium]|nr:TrkA family potassium uptake protein [Streptosporangiales bacterium]
MHCVILGCGRVGSLLANTLEQRGHSVAIIDQDTTAFRRLGSHFEGKRVEGYGFDRDVLIEAGIDQAHAFAAVSSGDNSNIITARIARETFGVENVVARIYDPRRAEVYQRLGIPTVATVQWTADQILRRLFPEQSAPDWQDATGTVMLTEVPIHPSWAGNTVQAAEEATGSRVVSIARMGEAVLPTGQTAIQEDDLVHVAVRTGTQAEVVGTLSKPPEGSD